MLMPPIPQGGEVSPHFTVKEIKAQRVITHLLEWVQPGNRRAREDGTQDHRT